MPGEERRLQSRSASASLPLSFHPPGIWAQSAWAGLPRMTAYTGAHDGHVAWMVLEGAAWGPMQMILTHHASRLGPVPLTIPKPAAHQHLIGNIMN